MLEMLFHPFTMMVLGLLTHFSVELTELSTQQNTVVHPFTYIKTRPYRVFTSAVGALLGYAMLIDTLPPDAIHSYMAFGAGYLADSGAKSAANITRNAITREATHHDQG